MKNIPSFDDFLNESIKKSEFLKLDDSGMADAIIDDSATLSFIGRDAIARVIMRLADSDTNKAKELVDSIDLSTLNLYALCKIAKSLPEYAKKAIVGAAKSNTKEKLGLSMLFDFYGAVNGPRDITPIVGYIPKTEILEAIVHCPTLIAVIDPKMCAIGAVAYKKLFKTVEFLCTPDEFISIKQKQAFMDNLPRAFKQKLKDYSNGDFSNVYGMPCCASFNNRFFVGREEGKYIGKYVSKEMMNTEEGVQYFNRWFSQLSA
jgi:hypothetical protein